MDYLTESLMNQRKEAAKREVTNADLLHAIEELTNEARKAKEYCRAIRWQLWVIGLMALSIFWFGFKIWIPT